MHVITHLPVLIWASLWLAPLVAAAAAPFLVPDAGRRVRSFELTLTWETYSPDGIGRKMALVNGQFPGPRIEVDQGDVAEVCVHNKMPYNTTVHFHGIEMKDSNWSDGVPGLTQRQIKTGSSFLYQWKATQYGSYWYHAHQRGQLDDGLYGPIIIRAKPNVERPFRLISHSRATLNAMLEAEKTSQALVLSDFRHITSEEGWAVEIAAGIETPCYDSILINGQGRVDCWSQDKINSLLSPAQKQFLKLGNESSLTTKGHVLSCVCLSANIIGNVLAANIPNNLSAVPQSIFDVCTPTNHSLAVIDVVKPACQQEKWVALDVIGAFGLMTGSFSIDDHPLYVYAVDGSYIEPTLVDAITVTNGDRYSVLIRTTKAGNFRIRFASTTAAQMIAGYATLSVHATGETNLTTTTTGTAYINDVGVNTTSSVVFFDQAAMKAFPPDSISATADRTFKLGIKIAGASYNWALNNSIYPMQLDNEDPLLFHPRPNINNNVTISTLYDEWIDLVFQDLTFPMPPHPIHKHGTKMWMIGSGTGTFDYANVKEAMQHIPQNFNLDTPPKRDTLATPAATTGAAWMVLRYHVSNPGAWFIHCHIQSHLLGGMSMAIQDGVDRWPTVPPVYLGLE